VAVKGAANEGTMMPLAKAPGAQFEVSIDGTHSAIVVRDLQSGEVSTNPIWGRAEIHTNSQRAAMTQKPKPPRPPKPPAPPPLEPLPPAA
jgi:hypothetical protein